MTANAATIFALATAPGKAGVAVVRLSGDGSRVAVEALAGPVGPPRTMSLRKLRYDGEVLDEALVVWFREGASFTGEECAELHLHGGRAVVKGVLEALSDIEGLRAAEAGEFTRRALQNGRMDLAQVEGLADLIDAQTGAQRRLAMGLVEGRLSGAVQSLRKGAIHALALIEASIDFADEDDAPVDVADEIESELNQMVRDLGALVKGVDAAASLREGYRVALIGAPNVGKSSLINAIAGREVAITSEIAGTTRDVIEVQCDIGGLPVTFIDTAGIRETSDAVEAIGVNRAIAAANDADLRLILETSGIAEPVLEVTEDDLRVWTMVDVHPADRPLAVSSRSGEGLERLFAIIEETLAARASSAGVTAHIRQAARFRDALASLKAASEVVGLELKSVEIRAALRSLDEVIGVVDTETVLSEIFSRFCMGK